MEQTTEKKEKKITKKGLIAKTRLFYILAYIGLFTPLMILVAINFDKYFITNKSAFSVATGGVLSGIFAILLVKVGFKKLHKAIWATFIVIIIWCFNSIIKDMLPISIAFWIGTMIFSIFEIPGKHYKKMLETWGDEEIRMYVRNESKENQGEENYGEV